jgi:hypothetical protein
MVSKYMTHDRLADGSLAIGVSLAAMPWLDQLNGMLDALAALAAIVASIAAAIYYFKGGKD